MKANPVATVSKLQLPPSVYSSQQLAVITTDLRRLIDWSNQQQIRHKVTGAGPVQPAPVLSEMTSQLLATQAHPDALTTAQLEQLLVELSELAEAAPQVQVTLAAMPGEGLRQKIVVWLRQNVHPRVIVSFGFDSNLLGGMVVRTPSHVLDWSFRRQILAGRDKFAEVLRRV